APPRGAGNCATNHDAPAPADQHRAALTPGARDQRTHPSMARSATKGRGELRDQPRRTRTR
ncbi:hypothetical protein ACFW26_18285, partial [Streptomyces sp. NPDC058867]